MTIDSSGRGHQPAGTPGGGQFTGNSRPQGPSLTLQLGEQNPPRNEAVVNELETDLYNLPAGVVPPLQHVQPGQQLSEEQIALYRAGKSEELHDTLAEWTTEQAIEHGDAFLRGYCKDRGSDYDADFDQQQKSRLRDAVWSKDPARPLQDLIRNTPAHLLQ